MQNESNVEWVNETFREFVAKLNGGSPSFKGVREEAMQRFSVLGFPTPQSEEWKYTNIAGLTRTKFKPAASGQTVSEEFVQRYVPEGVERIVFVDGHLENSLSASPSVTVNTIAACLKDADKAPILSKYLGVLAPFREEALVALNTAFLRDGVFLQFGRGKIAERPVHILFVSTGAEIGAAQYIRNVFVAEEGSVSTVVEHYVGLGDNSYFTSSVNEIFVERGASLNHIKIQEETEKAYHISNNQVRLDSKSNYLSHAFSFGGKLSRNDVSIVLNGERCVGTLNGLSILGSDQHVDNHTSIDHAKPHCESNELFKGVYGDHSHGVFNGTIIVRPDAQKTNAFQNNKSILLSNTAQIDAKPQLKIWADDVRCTHGATVGQLDETALFYIQSRGVPQREAKAMLIHAFASEVVSAIRDPKLQSYLEAILERKLATVL